VTLACAFDPELAAVIPKLPSMDDSDSIPGRRLMTDRRQSNRPTVPLHRRAATLLLTLSRDIELLRDGRIAGIVDHPHRSMKEVR
jgi:hypothetical protein